ncbi:nuclear transport factor 2 family protein [Olleya sp. AH-315-F22]|nr:nuclear transport factor 2 family protein [Olleya sp. AH-315-F22]
MKNQLICISIALLTLVACKQPAAVEESESPDYALFDKNVEVVRSFIKAHSEENLDAIQAILSDTLQYSPADYNGNQWLGKEEFITALKGYHDNFENLKFVSGIVTADAKVNGFWSGSVFPKETANSDGTNVRSYGTWSATHTASGKEIGAKWFALVGVNSDGQIASFSDYFDVNGLAAQIAAQEEVEE